MARTNRNNVNTNTLGDQLSDEQKALLEAKAEGAPISERPTEHERDVNRVLDNQEQEQAIITSRESMVLGIESMVPGIGDNQPPQDTPVEVIRREIVETYTPERSLIEAAADGREVLSGMDTLTNELQGTMTSRLSMDMADIAYWALQRKDGKEPALYPNADMAEKLVAHCKLHNLFGKPVEVGDGAGMVPILNQHGKTEGDTRVIVDRIDPYAGAQLVTLKDAAMRAALLVYKHVTEVTIGYIRKSESSGKRFSRSMVFLRKDQVTDDINNYYSAICIPTRIVIPCSYRITRSPDGKKNVFVPETESTDNSLRYLNADWAYADYMHHFGGKPLSFDVESTGSKLPTGMLLKQAPTVREPQPPGSKDEAAAIANFSEEAKKYIKDKEKAYKAEIEKLTTAKVGSLEDVETWRLVDALSKQVKDRAVKMPSDNGLVAIADLFESMMLFRIQRYSGKPIPRRLGKPLAQAFRVMETYIHHRDGDYYWLNDAGEELCKIDEDVEDTAQAA